ncbi:M23 family metallopeptidase [Flavobacteriaceae bacterium]|nr:M23 family metallopeptidase [Flavobacteriaceae bacterium]MDC1265638.1 M23 family metallopeptidase [Flavobacteriaceae bacterium]
MKSCIFLILSVVLFCNAQTPYPQDYFTSPLDITLVLSGTFAELRSNHFHSGLDIKTQGKEGFKTYAAAAGYISRIKISRYGYGKALYITHPNGYTTVYAHLQKFSPTIEAYVKKHQYLKEIFEIELFPKAEDLKVSAKELIAYTGNTGGSGGPHLHFEIRDKQERPMNPMLFGFDIKDTTKPLVYELFGYPLSEGSHINGETSRVKIRIIKLPNGHYKTEQITAFGKIGFGIVSTDRQDLAANKNGLNLIKTTFNGTKSLEVDFKRFSFNETKHLNRFIDYGYFIETKKRIQKLFIESNNPLKLLKNHENKGIVCLEDATNSIYKIFVSDYKGNQSELTIPIKGLKKELPETKPIPLNLHQIIASEETILEKDHVSVQIYKDSFYENVAINFEVTNDTLKLHKPIIPLQKSMNINFDISQYKGTDQDKLFVGSVSRYGNKLYYTPTIKRGNTLTARTKYLGNYTLGIDDENPKIEAINFKNGSWISNYRYLKVKISDEISGIKNYRATINDQWILMEYDTKTQMLTHDFNDEIITDTKNNLKIIVTDNVGNSSTFETTFYRK